MTRLRLINQLRRPVAVLLSASALLAGCTQDDGITDEGDRTAVTFNAGIKAATRTANGGNEWADSDKVGVFMVSANGDLPGDILTVGGTSADNREYNVTPVTGSLTPADGGALYYPQDGTPVDFIAYYPYIGTTGTGPGQITADGKYTLTVAGQTSEDAQNALDVLYAKTPGVEKSKTPVGLEFSHVLSKVTFNITLGEGLTALDGDDITAVEFSAMPLTASLDLQYGTLGAGTSGDFAAFKAGAASAGADATFTALVVPQSGMNTGRTAAFSVDGKPYQWNIPGTETFEAGQHYSYPITVKLSGVEVGSPTITDWNKRDHGTGEAVSPGIYTPDDLVAFSNDWNATGAITNTAARLAAQQAVIQEWGQSDGVIYLCVDLDMSGTANFTPIGRSDGNYSFTGSFDGQEHTISNLRVDKGMDDYVGLFGHLRRSATVRNIILDNCDIIGSNYVGGIAGYNAYSTISGCKMIGGTVTATGEYSGGIAGGNAGSIISCEMTGGMVTATSNSSGGIAGYSSATNAKIENCSVSGTGEINAANRAGGIAGENYGSISDCEMTGGMVTATGNSSGGIAGYNSGGTISGCEMTGGTVTATDSSSGGIAGNNLSSAKIENCTVSGNPAISAASRAGGIAGNSIGTIVGCRMTGGTVTAPTSSGGICGNNNDRRAVIENCTVSGDVKVSGGTEVGGITGYNVGIIAGCHFAGSSITGAHFVGGICGSNGISGGSDGTITCCKITAGAIVASSEYPGGIAGINYGMIAGCISSSKSITGSRRGNIVGHNYGSVTYCYGVSMGIGPIGRNDGQKTDDYRFDRDQVQTYFTSAVIDRLNQGANSTGTSWRWRAGTAESGWWPVAYIP